VTPSGWYRYSALPRTFDLSQPGNRAVLVVTAASAVAGLAWSLASGQALQAGLVSALMFPLAVFGSWALARELLPDDSAAAFFSMALAFMACLAFVTPGILPLYATLGLARMVNRSNGLVAHPTDSVAVVLLVILAVYISGNAWFAAVAALAFVLDASLKHPLRRQLLFAVVCIGTMVVYIVDHDVAWLEVHTPHTLLQWLAILASVLLALNMAALKKVHSRAEFGGKRLNLQRTRAGMVIAILACLQGLDNMPHYILLVATVGGLCLWFALRRSFRTTTKGLRH
jgi:hypothetical protein